MYWNYKLSHRLTACILLLSLFLQNCSNPAITLDDEEEIGRLYDTQVSIKKEQDKTLRDIFRPYQGHQITVHQQGEDSFVPARCESNMEEAYQLEARRTGWLAINGESEEKEKEEICREKNNDLPFIAYDNKRLLDMLEEFRMGEKVKQQVFLYLKNIEENITKVKNYRMKEHSEDFYESMKDAILEIHNTADEIYELIRPYNRALPNKLKSLIIAAITPLERELNRRFEMPESEREAVKLKTKRLYAEQSYICRHGALQKSLMEHLDKIKHLFSEVKEKGGPAPHCYISYAWPSKENYEQEYWVQPFLSIMYEHLTAAGIRVIMDIRDNKPGDSIYKFMERCHDGNYIILVGTESLLQKHRSDVAHAVKTELNIINDRFEEDQKIYGSSRIYPLLISGSNKRSLPEIYDKYRNVQDARDTGYLSMLRHLVDWMHEQLIHKAKTRYENLWYVFDSNCPKLYKDTNLQEIEEELKLDYHRQRLDYLKQGLQFQAVQAQKHSPAVIEGTDPRLFYSESGHQFQRPAITPDFVEREGLWKRIVTHFEQPEQQILTLSAHGLGGMGKTELAKYYYLHPPRPYILRAWFNAENQEQLYAQYVDFARANDIEFEEKMPIEERVKLIKNWLGTQRDCLLVYNNVPDAKQLEGLLPEQGKHHILITSRNAVNWPAHQKLDVDVMEEHEAITLICKITGCKEETGGLKELVRTLHYMPLALAQAGAYIAEKQVSVKDYLKYYQRYQSILMNDVTLALNPKHEPVWVTFNMNFKALEANCPSALKTLKRASWLDASVIPELLLETMLEDTKDRPAGLLWGEVKKHIGRYSLMRIDKEGHQLSIHRLVQNILRNQQDEVEKKRFLNQIALSIKSIYSIYENDKTEHNISIAKLLLPHIATTIAHLKEDFNEEKRNNFNLESILGKIYRDLGQYQEALKYCQQALEMRKHLYKGNHAEVAESINNLGLTYTPLVQYQKALKHLREALAMRQTLYAGDHPDIATSLYSIGTVYYSLGKYRKALKYHEEAFKMRNTIKNKAIYAGNHVDIVLSLNQLGSVHKMLGQYKEALVCTKQALEMGQALYTYNHPVIVLSLTILGDTYQALEQYKEALAHHRRALEINQTLYKDNHPSIIWSLNSLGGICSRLGQYEKALKYVNRALAVGQLVYASQHPAIVWSLNSLGDIYKQLGQYEEALKHTKQALEMSQILHSGNHPQIANSSHNIGSIYQVLGQGQEALKYLTQALEIRKPLYKDNHPDIATSLYNIGLVNKDLGQYKEALEYYEQALKMFEALHPDELDHPDIQRVKTGIAQLYQARSLRVSGG